jgi:superfamily II DNA or RNA helicase
MRLRPRQKTFVERSLAALNAHGNTLGIAPTGAGKTIMLSAVTGEVIGDSAAKACVLAHRDELTDQNRGKFARVNPRLTTSVVDASAKSWPTLARLGNLAAIPQLDLLVIDEAHHAVAASYRRIIDQVRNANPDARIFGVTATPNRGDRQGLREVFDNVADQVRLGELIASGHLVPPRTFVIDVGVQDKLRTVRKSLADFDMAEVASIMDRAPVTDEVIRHWKEKAGDRQAVVFCSTVAHAAHVTEAFNAADVPAGLIHGDLPSEARRNILAAYAAGEIRVIVNVAVLTEGWDHPPTSCVVLLRPSSYKSTMIQMIGRGLRTIDPEEHPNVIKTDCVVMDFGTSSLIHGTLEQDVDLDGKTETGDAPTKVCPGCGADIPLACFECPLCGEVLGGDEDGEAGAQGRAELTGFIMTEIDLLKRSSFAWIDLFGADDALMANGFNAWGGIFFLEGRWHAVGGAKGQNPRLLGIGERTVCLAQADDWLNEVETDESAFKTRGWLNQAATEKQLQYLAPAYRQDYGLTRYDASALMTFTFNKRAIRQLIMAAAPDARRAA